MRNKEIVFFDNYDSDNFREATIENILANDIDGKYESEDDISEDEIWNEIRYQEEFEFECFEYEIDRLMRYDHWLVCGTVGRWNGNFKGGCLVNSIRDIINKVGKDCDYFKFYEEDGHFYIKCSHHDGTNLLEMKRITKKGVQYYSEHEFEMYEHELHEKIWHSNFFSSLPHFGKKLGFAEAM